MCLVNPLPGEVIRTPWGVAFALPVIVVRHGPPAPVPQPRTRCGIDSGITSDISTNPRYSPFSNQGDW